MSELAKALGASLKNRTPLIGAVERHLLGAASDTDRRSDCIHPSEAAKEHWCPRATYYRIAGFEAEPGVRKLSMEMVFETGHDAHRKWQNWYREMGMLGGQWACIDCRWVWDDVSPLSCPKCKQHQADHIVYREVPVFNEKYLLAGHADGLVLGDPIEVKTIGTGTLRYEAPKLLERYSYEHIDTNDKTHKGTDWPALWAGIRRPFASHLRQGMLYMFMAGWESMSFIYDPKFVTGYPKEFKIKFQQGIIDDILEDCLRVKAALEKQRPPKRPYWAEETVSTCTQCPFRKVCYASRRRDSEDRSSEVEGQVRVSKKRTSSPASTKIRFAESPYELDGSPR